MSTELPITLYPAIGAFQSGANWIVVVTVPNFPTKGDAEAYAAAFRIRFVDGRLYRDDGKGIGMFDDSWREVLDSQVTISRVKTPGQESVVVARPIAEWHLEPGLIGDFEPVAWHVEQEKIG